MTINILSMFFSCLNLHYVLIFQVVSQYSSILSPIAVDAVMKVINPATATNVDLKDIKIVKKIGYIEI